MKELSDPSAVGRFLHPDGVVLMGRVPMRTTPDHLLARERGIRGSSRLDVDGVAETIKAVAFLMASSGGRLAELEINPLIVSTTGAVAVDVLAVAGA